jgi:hypothetical protein
MEKLSALVFSRDNAPKTMRLVNDIVGICDQVVVVHSGKKSDFAKLNRITGHIPKVDLYHTIALGYADPMRAHGLSKCKHNWILYIDTDERVNEELKSDMRKIINSPKCDAFAIKRYEHAHLNGNRSSFFTWQIRLYKRNKIRYRGLLHEQPIVDGRLKKLGGRYCLLHIEELKAKGPKRTDLEYSLIKSYHDRLSYRMLNERVKEYIAKLVVPEGKRIEDTRIGKSILGWLNFYRAMALKKKDDEISTFDYFMFYLMIEGAYTIKEGDIRYLFNEAIPTIIRDTKRVSRFRGDINSNEIFAISKALNKEGMIKYLMLDNEKVVETLNRKYGNSKQGIGLLIKLLNDRYNSRYP